MERVHLSRMILTEFALPLGLQVMMAQMYWL